MGLVVGRSSAIVGYEVQQVGGQAPLPPAGPLRG